MPSNLSTWTDERIANLREWAPQYSASEIAQKFGWTVSRNAVIGKCKRMGITLNKAWTRGPAKPKWGPERNLRRKQQRWAAKGVSIRPSAYITPTPRNLHILQLEPGDCRWPVNDGPPMQFCGCAVLPDESYCGWHYRRAHARTA